MGDNHEMEELTIPIPPQPHSENMDAESSVGEHGDSLSADCEQPPEENSDRKGCCSCKDVFVFLLTPFIFIIFFCIGFFWALGAYLACGINVTGKSTNQEGGKKGIYQKVQDFQGKAVLLAKQVSVIRGRVSFCVLFWFVVNISFPSLRRKTVFGSQLWKWTLLSVIVTCGYSAISIASHRLLNVVKFMHRDKNDFFYYLIGLRRSISFIIYSVTVLSTWLFYFRSRHGLRGRKTHISDDVFDFMTWTLVSLLISALLWLLKTVLLLKWEAHAVYKRFRDRILRAGFQLYFLALISGTHCSIFRPGENRDVDDKVEKAGEEKSMKASGEKDNTTVRAATNDRNNNAAEDGRKEKGKEEEKRTDKDITQDDQKDKKEKEETRKAKDEEDKRKAKDIPQDGKKEKEEEEKKKAKDILNIDGRMQSKNVTTYGIEQMARHFVALAKLSSKKDDDISDLLAECRKAVSRAIKRDDLEYEIDKNSHITEDNLHDAFPLDDDEVKLVFTALKEMHASEKVSYATLEQWMVRAHKHCLALGYTLTDAKKVVDCLNKLMIGFLIVVVILSWLLLTEIATTKLLLIIASPILAATFIFGDTCKTLFEGIIFAFVKHPFDVGDLCIIGNIKMEVKRMGILTTSFLMMGTKDQAIYPNSVFATKSIVNLKGDPDPTDFVELSLDPTTKMSEITELKGKINEYLSSDDHKEKFENSSHIVIKEIGNNIRIAIHFKHMVSILDMTHSQSIDKKNRQRLEFLFKVKQILEGLRIKTSTAS